MPLVTEEQDEKRPSQFIKLEDKSKLTLYSNLYKAKTHFLKARNTSVLCVGDSCVFCGMGMKSRMEYFYYGNVDGEEGIVRVPASVFFALNENERVLEIDKRSSIWVISKKGSGLDTEYGIARGKEAGTPTISLEEANEKMTKVLDNYVKSLEQKYRENSAVGVSDKEAEEIFSESKEPENE